MIKKFVEDFGRLYKDFLLAGTLHDFVRIQLSVDADTEEALRSTRTVSEQAACKSEFLDTMSRSGKERT